MYRVKLQFDCTPLFQAHFILGSRDINYGGHLGNDSLVALLQESRILWLRSHNYSSEVDIDGAGWIQADLQVQYIKEAFLGDTIAVTLGAVDIQSRGFTLLYKITKESDLIALAATNLLFMDYASRKLTTIPINFSKILTK